MSPVSTPLSIIITTRACARGKVIGRVIVIVVVVVDTKIIKSGDLGTPYYGANCKRNESIEFSEN